MSTPPPGEREAMADQGASASPTACSVASLPEPEVSALRVPPAGASIDTADHVLHEPTGETWVVACVRGDKLSWCGWPEGMADLKDCQLIKKATLHQRDALLREMAGSTGNDHRTRYARERLARGIGAEGQDAQRLGAEPAEPGGDSHAPNPDPRGETNV